MYKKISRLVLYRNLEEDSILYGISKAIRDYELKKHSDEEIVNSIYREIKKLLNLATLYGFDKNLWQNYLTFLLINDENSFSMICENAEKQKGSVNQFAKNDFMIFKSLFDYDFSTIEKDLCIDCFSTICNYRSIVKKERMYNKNVSEKVKYASEKIDKAKNEEEVFKVITELYSQYGVGNFGLNKAFLIEEKNKELEFLPINNMDNVTLDDLIGYEMQKNELIENTEAFINGKAANNVLLFGDSGTGKSTSIKAIVNRYYEEGLRMIEIYKHQFRYLSKIISNIKNRNYKFIIYMDDLSFEEFETEYKFLKAVIEGGVESKPDNILIYATSNRRHLIKETWKDRTDMEVREEIHRSDTMQEKLSLVNRFGITIGFYSPSRKEYIDIVLKLARKHKDITLSDEELTLEANRWEMLHGGISGRTAQQFINYLLGKL